MGRIICFGEALIDFLGKPGTHPPQFVAHAGGAPANVAVAAARLGGAAAFVGMLAEDMFGEFLLRAMRDAGVNTDYLRRTNAANTALAFVALDANGERHFSFYRPPAADLLFRAEHFAAGCFESVTAFHACSNSLTETPIAEATFVGMERARNVGALMSFDVNLRLNLWPQNMNPRPYLWKAMQAAHLIKLTAVELKFLAEPWGDERAVLTRLWQEHAELVLVTDGAAPIRYFTRARESTVTPFPVVALDTTAAGDAFVGGLLYWLARADVTASGFGRFANEDARFNDALRFAAACGALAVTQFGAFSAMPTLSEVDGFLRTRR